MIITIIGLYGTETIGDRAILAGLFSIFRKAFDDFEIKLGSLYPFFSQRMVAEDSLFWSEITGKNIKIELFDCNNSAELDRAIKESNLIAAGGGPLMHIDELYMYEYAFKKAKKLSKATALLGCGIGPLFQRQYEKSVLEISKNSDLIILRDTSSRKSLNNIFLNFNFSPDRNRIFTSLDPSVECLSGYRESNTRHESDYISANLRAFPADYARKKIDLDRDLQRFIGETADKYKTRDFFLIPMHYFHVGNDDRVFLNQMALNLKKPNLKVQNRNLTLKETIEKYQNAHVNIGMRFHSVVFQTLVSGKNYILDYTPPREGKISGFLQDLDRDDFYKTRYLNLQTDELNSAIIKDENACFTADQALIKEKMNIYLDQLKNLNL